MKNVIHIYGASGSGTSTLGRKICEETGYFFMDTDDYYWLPVEPKYSQKRAIPERLVLMKKDIEEHDNVVISGSLVGWGDELIPYFTLAIRVVTDSAIRIERLRKREYEQFGDSILPSGERYEEFTAFIEWASKYDTGGLEVRSKVYHDEWEKLLKCKKIVVTGSDDLDKIYQKVKEALNETEDSFRIYLEDGKLKVQGCINLGYIGLFKDSQIEIEDSLEEIREWDIIEEYYNPNCTDDELIDYLNVYYKSFIQKIEKNLDNINGEFLLQVFTDMDNCELDFMTIDGLFDEKKLIYGNEEDIAEIYNPVRQGLHSLSPYLETPNDGSIPKGHIESVLRSFYPMFNFNYFLKNIVPENIGLGDGEISFQCSDNFDATILCGAYAVIDEELAFSDWHNF